jgi:hypothetical protein
MATIDINRVRAEAVRLKALAIKEAEKRQERRKRREAASEEMREKGYGNLRRCLDCRGGSPELQSTDEVEEYVAPPELAVATAKLEGRFMAPFSSKSYITGPAKILDRHRGAGCVIFDTITRPVWEDGKLRFKKGSPAFGGLIEGGVSRLLQPRPGVRAEKSWQMDDDVTDAENPGGQRMFVQYPKRHLDDRAMLWDNRSEEDSFKPLRWEPILVPTTVQVGAVKLPVDEDMNPDRRRIKII